MSNRKIKIGKKHLDSSQINKHQDFAKVSKQVSQFKWLKSTIGASAGIASVVIGLVMAYQLNKVDDQTVIQENEILETVEVKEKDSIQEVSSIFDNTAFEAPADTIRFNNKEGLEFEYYTGSKISIPPYAFGKEDREVAIAYKEFHESKSVFMEDISMAIKGDSLNMLESDGMFEFKVLDESLEIEEDIIVDLKHTRGMDKLNQYYMANEDESWEQIGTVDTEKYLWENVKLDQVREPEVQYIKPIEAIAMNFQVEVSYNTSEFKELSLYDRILFEVDRNHPKFNNAFYKVKWDKVNIKRGDSSDYILVLKKFSKTHEISAQPVFEGENFDKAMTAYNYWQHECQAKTEPIYEKKPKSNYRESYANTSNESPRVITSVTTASLRTLFTVRRPGFYNLDYPMPRKTDMILAVRSYVSKSTKEEVKAKKVGFLGNVRTYVFVQGDLSRLQGYNNGEGTFYVKSDDACYKTTSRDVNKCKSTGILMLIEVSKLEYFKAMN